MSAVLFLLAASLFAIGGLLWLRAPALFAAIQHGTRSDGPVLAGDVDDAGAWVGTASPAQGQFRLRLVAVVCLVTGVVVAGLGIGA